MFSKACEYGIRAVIYIVSVSATGKKAGIKDICKHIKAPEPFTAKILQNLSRLGIIKSAKGPHGGFYVEQANNIRLIDVVTAIDGDKLFTGCGLGVDVCSEKKPCPIHNEFKTIREALRSMLESTSIQDIAKDLEKGLVFLKT